MRYQNAVFIRFQLVFAVLAITIASCSNPREKEEKVAAQQESTGPFFKLSLAQWSLHKQIYSGELSPLDFAQKANELGFEGIEYVSGLYAKELEKDPNPEKSMQDLLVTLKANSEKYNVRNVLIMVDGEGELASPDEELQNAAIENHKKWVDAAEFLGCHSIRVNLFGTDDPDVWTARSTIGLTKLSEYAAARKINILVENHGSFSSNGSLLAKVMEAVNMSNCGTLPDFGNFCIKREASECIEDYDKYRGVEELMPFALAVSAKSYDFDENGNEVTIDYKRMLQIVYEVGYRGYIGVEYEGSKLSEIDGTLATKKLLLEVAKDFK